MSSEKKKVSTTFVKFLESLKVDGSPSFNYGNQIEELRLMDGFFKKSSACLFVADIETARYLFVSDAVNEVMGHRHEAVMEGGMEYIDYFVQAPDYANMKAMNEQLRFFEEYKKKDMPEARFKFVIPWLDEKKKPRYFFQQYNVVHRNSEGLPLGFYGFCMDFTDVIKESVVTQQIELFNSETQGWDVYSRLEIYPQTDDDKLLSKREIEILKWMSEGLSSKEIAQKLFISVHTVNTHRKNMLARTNAKNSSDLILYGIQHKLI